MWEGRREGQGRTDEGRREGQVGGGKSDKDGQMRDGERDMQMRDRRTGEREIIRHTDD